LERLAQDAGPLKGKKVLVLCSAAGDVAFYLAEQVGPNGTVIGLELNEVLLQHARLESHKRNVSIEFRKAEMYSIPFPDESFDALISEFIVYPTPEPTLIGQPEMARVLKPGGWLLLTDVIVTKPLSEEARAALRAIGLDYLCEATPEDFREWMGEAGLVDVEIHDWTPLLRQVWEQRRVSDREPGHRAGYTLLLEDQGLRLGEAIFYLYVRGRKPV
jgi:arsenite methyltransferase